jgi:hypothetical protein
MLVLDLCEGNNWLCHLDFSSCVLRDFWHPDTHSSVVLAIWHVLFQLPRLVVVIEATLADIDGCFA